MREIFEVYRNSDRPVWQTPRGSFSLGGVLSHAIHPGDDITEPPIKSTAACVERSRHLAKPLKAADLVGGAAAEFCDEFDIDGARHGGALRDA